jgi:hypothetical protein
MSDGQSDYHRMYSSPLGREYEAAARKTAAASTRIWETLQWVPMDPYCYAMRPMTAADLGLPEHVPPFFWLGREAE